MRFLLVLLLVLVANATDMMMRTGTAGGAQISTCTNATPAVCTTLWAHGLADGDRLIIFNVTGSNGVNGVGTRYAKVTSYSTTTFGVYSDSGLTTPVAAGGAWTSHTGVPWVAKVAPYTLVGHPRVMLDGPTGEWTRSIRCTVVDTCLTSISVASNVATATTISGWRSYLNNTLTAGMKIAIYNATGDADLNNTWTVVSSTATSVVFTTSGVSDGTYSNSGLTISRIAVVGNPLWDQLLSTTNVYSTTYVPRANVEGTRTVLCAYRYWIDRSMTNCATILHDGLTHVEDMVGGTYACSNVSPFCGGRLYTTDNPRFIYSLNIGQAYSIAEAIGGILSAPEKATLIEKIFTDMHDEGDSCTRRLVTAGPSSVVCSGTTCTGTGLGSIPVGSIAFLGGVDDAPQYNRTITAVTATTLTLDAARTYTGTFAYGEAWQPGDCGWMNVINAHHGNMGTNPTLHPPNIGEIEGTGSNFFHNLPLTSLMTQGMAIAFADDSVDARKVYSKLQTMAWDLQIANAMTNWTGFTQAGVPYGFDRSPWFGAMITWWWKTNVSGYVDLTGTAWLKNTLLQVIYSASDGIAGSEFFFLPFGQGSPPTIHSKSVMQHHVIAKMFPGTDVAAMWRYFAYTRYGVTPAFDQATGVVNAFLSFDPNHAAVNNNTLPLQKIFNTSDYDTCKTLNMTLCNMTTGAGTQQDFFVSRGGGWNSSTNSRFAAHMGTIQGDHQYVSDTGHYAWGKGTVQCFMGGDASPWECTGLFQLEGGNNFFINSTGSLLEPTGLVVPAISATAHALRWKMDDVNNYYAYAVGDLTGNYKSSVSPGLVQRHFLHLKKSGTEEMAIVYTLGNKLTNDYFFEHINLRLNSQVTTTVSGGGALNTVRQLLSTSTAGTEGMTTAIIAPTGQDLFVWNPTDADVYKVQVCGGSGSCQNNSNSYEAILLYKMFGGTPNAITYTALNPSADWTGFTSADHTVMIARTGATLQTSLPSVTTATTTDFYTIGLEPDTYKYQLGGVDVPGCTGIEVTATDGIAVCGSVGAGAVTLVQDVAGPLTITTTTLTNGQVGSAYSQALSATGGDGTNVWDTSVGTICDGLTLNADGTITGTPTTAEVCSFTARVTDVSMNTDTQALTITINEAGVAIGVRRVGKVTSTGKVSQ